MREVVKVEGFRELDAALAELPRSFQKGVLTRTLKKAAEPIADAARGMVPVDKGDLKASIAVSPKVKNEAGRAEFAAAMRAGLGKGAAVQAMRDARRENGTKFSAVMHVGPAVPRGFHGHFVEFGTVKMGPEPFMRPAWDGEKHRALQLIKTEMSNELIKAAKRVARSKKFGADVKYRASLAAMMAAGY